MPGRRACVTFRGAVPAGGPVHILIVTLRASMFAAGATDCRPPGLNRRLQTSHVCWLNLTCCRGNYAAHVAAVCRISDARTVAGAQIAILRHCLRWVQSPAIRSAACSGRGRSAVANRAEAELSCVQELATSIRRGPCLRSSSSASIPYVGFVTPLPLHAYSPIGYPFPNPLI